MPIAPATFYDHLAKRADPSRPSDRVSRDAELTVGSVGDSFDTALARTINGLFKAGVIHRRRPLRGFDAVEYATLECADRFSTRHTLEPTGSIPSGEAQT